MKNAYYSRGHSPGYKEYRTCKRKKTFYTSQQAVRAVKEASRRGKNVRGYYWCPYCHRYHITSKDQHT